MYVKTHIFNRDCSQMFSLLAFFRSLNLYYNNGNFLRLNRQNKCESDMVLGYDD